MSTLHKGLIRISVLLIGAISVASAGGAADDYPVEPDPPGSGNVNWTESPTPDGWIRVTNEGGKTLGYSPDSGLELIQVDGLAFKDMNRNGLLDLYEDWRVDYEARAASLADELTAEQMMGLKMNPSRPGNPADDELEDETKEQLGKYFRTLGQRATTAPVELSATWNNLIQAYVEGLGSPYIPAAFQSDPRGRGTDMSKWPGYLGIAATFDPEVAAQYGRLLSEEWRALGISMKIAPQMDLATDPRWKRNDMTFGEDPALSMDMAVAMVNAWQSTYDEDGNDLGWGDDSVNCQIKHVTGDGAGEGGRESHTRDGAYNVFPGGQFFTHLLPFTACLDLPGKTKSASAAMTNFSVAVDADGAAIGGVRSATSFNKYKLQTLFRGEYGFDGFILTDFGIINGKPFGVEDETPAERMLLVLEAGNDGFGGERDYDLAMEAYRLGVAKHGEEEMLAMLRESTVRVLEVILNVGMAENPYVSVQNALAVVGNDENRAAGFAAQLKSLVMLKNSGNIIQRASAAKPTVYIPWQFTAAARGRRARPASIAPTFDLEVARRYFNVVTDRAADTLTGPVDDEGNPTGPADDIVRASAAEIQRCDFALVRIESPQNGNPTYGGRGATVPEGEEYTYRPISLRYRPYTADSEFVRRKSIAGDLIETEVDGPYGKETEYEKENRSYFGQTGIITNEIDLDLVLYAASVADKVIVAADVKSTMIFSEFENEVDAILVAFAGDRAPLIDDAAFLEIVSGRVEPSGLLPIQMPKSMETVEAQFEDVPRDVECHVDSEGHTYDFAYGLDWSGVIRDDRTAKYDVRPIVGKPPT